MSNRATVIADCDPHGTGSARTLTHIAGGTGHLSIWTDLHQRAG